MLNAIKDLSVSSLSPIGFKVKWHNSRSDKWYQRQGHGFESQECHCEKWIVRVGHNLTWVCLPHHQLVVKTLLGRNAIHVNENMKNYNAHNTFLIDDWYGRQCLECLIEDISSMHRQNFHGAPFGFASLLSLYWSYYSNVLMVRQ